MEVFLQQLVNGIGQGSVYALIAVGYTMVYGILGLINFAHGDVFALAPVIVLTVYLPTLMFLLPANWMTGVAGLLIAAAVCGTAGFLIERIAYRPLRKPYPLRTCLLVTLVTPALFAGAAWAMPTAPSVMPGDPARLTSAVSEATDDDGRLDRGEMFKFLNDPEPVRRAKADGWRKALWVLAAGSGIYGLGLFLNALAFRLGVGKADRLTALITAIGVSLFLQNFLRLEELYGSRQKGFPSEMLSAPLASPLDPPTAGGVNYEIGPVTISRLKVIVLATVIALMAVLTYIVKFTRIGMAMRAVSFNHDSARLMGINVDAVISFTFVLGSVLAAVGGLLFAATYPSAITPLIGNQPGTKAFTAAVLGGIGNIPGAVLGGLLLGVMEALLSASESLSKFSEALSFVVLILILLFKPAGLLGRNVPEKV
jgi:branched-chain amino acid transport system permease protein